MHLPSGAVTNLFDLWSIKMKHWGPVTLYHGLKAVG